MNLTRKVTEKIEHFVYDGIQSLYTTPRVGLVVPIGVFEH